MDETIEAIVKRAAEWPAYQALNWVIENSPADEYFWPDVSITPPDLVPLAKEYG